MVIVRLCVSLDQDMIYLTHASQSFGRSIDVDLGYITLALASAINYTSAAQSTETISLSATPATRSQQVYALATSCTTMIIAVTFTLIHLDQYTPLEQYWIKAFSPKSRIELVLILFLVLWWTIATWIQTSIQGICGEGKGQYNLYFSTWACCWTSIWTLERWMVASGLASLKQFMASFPNRAPGFLALFVLSLCTLLCFTDSYVNWEEGSTILQDSLNDVGRAQWLWLFFVTSLTIPCSVAFVLVEIFREDRSNADNSQEKTQLEMIFEGAILLVLVLVWIPSVIVATTPGGVASLVGNSYFFTWATTVFVMETAVWWVHDWRKRIHEQLQEQQDEYLKIQQEVLAKSRQSGESSNVDTNATADGVSERNAGEQDAAEAPVAASPVAGI